MILKNIKANTAIPIHYRLTEYSINIPLGWKTRVINLTFGGLLG